MHCHLHGSSWTIIDIAVVYGRNWFVFTVTDKHMYICITNSLFHPKINSKKRRFSYSPQDLRQEPVEPASLRGFVFGFVFFRVRARSVMSVETVLTVLACDNILLLLTRIPLRVWRLRIGRNVVYPSCAEKPNEINTPQDSYSSTYFQETCSPIST